MRQYIIDFFKIASLAFTSELKRIIKDPGAVLILIGALIIYPVIYSIAYKKNVLRDIPIAVVDLDHTLMSRKVASMIGSTAQMEVAMKCGSLKEAQNLFWDGKVHGIIVLPNEFEKAIYNGHQTHVGVYCDASYFLLYKQTLTGTLTSVSTLSAGLEIRRLMATGKNMHQAFKARDPLPMNIHSLYNPSGSYGSYLLPGLLIVILQQTLLIGIGLVGGAKKEKISDGTQSVNKRLRQGLFSVVIGRSLAYFVIYIFNSVFTLIWLYDWFGYPDKGSLVTVVLILLPFLFSTIFLGLSISQLFQRREHSIMFLVFLSPLVLFLTGMSWPIEAIPEPLYAIAHIFPTTLMVPAYLRVRSMGVSLGDVSFEAGFMIAQTVAYFLLAVLTLKLKRKRIY